MVVVSATPAGGKLPSLPEPITVKDHPIPGRCFGSGGKDRDRRAFLREEFACPYLARQAQEYPYSGFAIHTYPFAHLFYMDLIHVVLVLCETPQDLVRYGASELSVEDSVDCELLQKDYRLSRCCDRDSLKLTPSPRLGAYHCRSGSYQHRIGQDSSHIGDSPSSCVENVCFLESCGRGQGSALSSMTVLAALLEVR